MIRLDIQRFGGRGASSSLKTYTSKDIKTLRDNYGVSGYELNNNYLLKKYYGLTGNKYYWIINTKKEETYWFYGDFSKAVDRGEIITVSNAKEGKEKLIELANKRRK